MLSFSSGAVSTNEDELGMEAGWDGRVEVGVVEPVKALPALEHYVLKSTFKVFEIIENI